MAINVNMFIERFTTDAQPRWKNGQPPQRTTGLASKSSSHANPPPEIKRCTGMPGSMPAIAIPSSGAVSAKLTQNRRVMSRSSGLSSSAATVRGSKAIPQIGQCPGPSRTISGCIGQVYSLSVAASGISRSNAIPQLGQGFGFVSRTSGHMGQTYALPEIVLSCGSDLETEDGITTNLLCAPCVSELRYFSGSALNLLTHPALQK